MSIQFLSLTDRSIANCLRDNVTFRIPLIKQQEKYTLPEILGDLLFIFPISERQDVKRIFNTLAVAGELAYSACGKNAEGEVLFRICPEVLEEFKEQL